MSKRTGATRRLWLLLAFSVGMLAAGYYLYVAPEASFWHQLATGILGSLIAAVVYSILTVHLIRGYEEDWNELKGKIEEISKRDLSGVKSISSKYEYNPEFWNGLLSSTNQKLFLMGHALSRWCAEPYCRVFYARIRHICEEGGMVKILILHPNGGTHTRREAAAGVSYKERVGTTLSSLKREVHSKLPSRAQRNLEIKWISDLEMPYMYIRTDSTTIISPYMAAIDSKDALLLILDPASRYASAFNDDFIKLFDRAEIAQWQ